MKNFLLTILSIFSFGAIAQHGTISGHLTDQEDSQAIPYANVILLTLKQDIAQGTIADEKGNFILTNVPFGKYYISFQSLTHQELASDTFEISSTNPTKIFKAVQLEKSITETDVVQLTFDKAAVKIEPAKKTFDVKATGADAGGTASEMLTNLPSVDVDEEGTISLRGNTNLRILVDGKPAGINEEDIALVLAQLPANTVESVEIITVPSAKYDPEGVGGIINIILKKERKKGINGSANVNYGMNDKVNATLSTNYQTKKFGVTASYSLRDGNYWSKSSHNAFTTTNDSTTWFDTQNDFTRRKPAHVGKLGLNYNVNKKTSFNIEGSINHMNKYSSGLTEYDWNYNNQSTENAKRYVDKSGSRTNGYGQLGISTKIKKTKITAFSRYLIGDSPNEGLFTENYSIQKEIRGRDNSQFVNQIDIEIPIQKIENDSLKKTIKIETGIKTNHRNFTESFDFYNFSPSLSSFLKDEEISNQLTYGDEVFAGYAIYNYSKNSIQTSFGLRAEYTNISSTVSETTFNKEMFNLFPSFSIVDNINDFTTLSLSYSKRIKRPSGRQLNPIPSYANQFSAHVGNAELIPERSHLAELSFLKIFPKLTFNSTLYYQYRDDRMGRLSYTDSVGYTVIQWINFNFHQTSGLELFFNWKFKKWMHINSSGTFYRTWVDGENFQDGYIANYNGYDLKANFKFMPKKNTSITLTGNYNSKRIAVVGVVLPRYGADISFKHKFYKNKAFVTLRYTDLFKTRGFWIDVDVDNWFRGVSHTYESQILWFGLGYSFGKQVRKGKHHKPRKSRGGDAM